MRNPSALSKRNATNKDGEKLFKRSDDWLMLVSEIKPNNENIKGVFIEDYWQQPHIVERVNRYAEAYYNNPESMPALVVEITADGVICRDGDHRLRAIKQANERLEKEGKKTIERISVEQFKGSDLDRKLIMVQRHDVGRLSVIEKAELAQWMKDEGMTTVEVANHLNLSDSRVRQLLELAKLDVEKKAAIQSGAMTINEALRKFRSRKVGSYKPTQKEISRLMDDIFLSKGAVSSKGTVTVNISADLYEKIIGIQ